MHPRQLAISNFAYDLPDSQVALYPLSKRDDAKLLIYREGEIKTSTYQHIADYIPAGSLLLFNNTKVIILSSTIDPEDLEKSNKYPMVIDFISKPITKEVLENLKILL